MQINELVTEQEIAESFDAFFELRPSLLDIKSFIKQMKNQQKEGYQIFAITKENEIMSCIGFRRMTTLAWGKTIYIDDLVTKEKYQGRGYGKFLLDYVTDIGKTEGYHQIHLDTGYARYAAHKLYLKHGFELHCHHLALKL